MIELVDSHCHIHSINSKAGEAATRELWEKAGNSSVEDVLDRAYQAGVTCQICVGCDLKDSQLAVHFAAQHESCWASVGVHPHEARHHLDAATQKEFRRLVDQPRVVAVGECGLDYFYSHSPPGEQAQVLRFQIELALEHAKPLIFHVRDAFDDFWPIFESYQTEVHTIRGVLHSFTDSRANLERALSHGLFIGVNGIATFTKNPEQQAIYRTIPLASLLLETDAPFLTPVPYRGKVCEPYHIRTIAEFLAEQQHETVARLSEMTTQNAQRLFSI